MGGEYFGTIRKKYIYYRTTVAIILLQNKINPFAEWVKEAGRTSNFKLKLLIENKLIICALGNLIMYCNYNFKL